MNPTRLWTLGAVVAVVAILGAAVGLGVQPALASAAAADASTAQVRQTNAGTQTELLRLAGLAAKESDLQQQNERVGRAVTGSLRWNTFTQQLRDAAEIDGVKIVSLTTADAQDYTAPVAEGGAAPAAAAAGSSTPTPTPTPGSTATAVPAPLPAAQTGIFAKTDPLISGSDLVVIPVTVAVSGNEAAGIAFAQDAQQMARLFAVNNVVFTRGTATGSAPTTTISGDIYALRG